MCDKICKTNIGHVWYFRKLDTQSTIRENDGQNVTFRNDLVVPLAKLKEGQEYTYLGHIDLKVNEE